MLACCHGRTAEGREEAGVASTIYDSSCWLLACACVGMAKGERVVWVLALRGACTVGSSSIISSSRLFFAFCFLILNLCCCFCGRPCTTPPQQHTQTSAPTDRPLLDVVVWLCTACFHSKSARQGSLADKLPLLLYGHAPCLFASTNTTPSTTKTTPTTRQPDTPLHHTYTHRHRSQPWL